MKCLVNDPYVYVTCKLWGIIFPEYQLTLENLIQKTTFFALVSKTYNPVVQNTKTSCLRVDVTTVEKRLHQKKAETCRRQVMILNSFQSGHNG